MFVLESINKYAKTGRIAWRGREGSLSFAELDARSEAFAAWLTQRFGSGLSPVMIYGQKEKDFLPCVFGALKSGRAYVPVDASMPPGRAMEIAAEVKPCVIADFSGIDNEPLTAANNEAVLDGKALESILQAPPKMQIPRERWVAGENTAYILFTSGSTGKPKGVPITAANLGSFYRGLLPYMPGEEGGVILDQVSYSFDVSCCPIYAGLGRGMTLLAVDKEMTEDIGALFGLLRDSGLNMWVSTPSFAEVCVRSKAFSSELMPFLRDFLFCGEVLTHKLCDQLAERFPKTRLLNTYGPTEATVLVTAVCVTEEMRRAPEPIPIGRPLDGVELRLDAENGCGRGELLIIGGSVGPGYHMRPDLTAERFFQDKETGRRGYRTGDICTCCGGLYYYLGRADNQLKISGYRVEIEDIEKNLAKLDNILQAAVIPVWEDEKVQYLAAFILPERDDGLTPLKRAITIKKQAAALLPAYMIPRKFIAMDAFPLNINGKIDKKELAKRLLETENTKT